MLASVALQHSEIPCLTDASDKCLQRRKEEYRSGKSDMHETIKDFDGIENLGQGLSLIGWLI
jgi:hypothetical protein